MIVTSARIQNYRSYEDSSFEFDKGVNIIVGPNASGKTNLLDSIYFALSGAPLIKAPEQMKNNQSDWARIDCLTDDSGTRIVKIKENIDILIDEKLYKRVPVKERYPAVVFEPKHLYLITTSPEMRRSYIDDILSGIDAEFVTTRSQYQKTLRQRNALLKENTGAINKQIFAWDIRLSELGGKYSLKRSELIKQINKSTSKIYSSIAGKKHELKISYESKNSINNYADDMLQRLQRNVEIDQMRGFTTTGPHRDDIRLVLDGNDMRDRASRGETRSILLTLKIIESSILESVLGKKPILLLDDVFGELDGQRRKALIDFMKDNQVFITTTDADILSHKYAEHAKIIFSNQG